MDASGTFFLVSEDEPDLFFQIRQIIPGIVPENRRLDPEIDMNCKYTKHDETEHYYDRRHAVQSLAVSV